MLYICNKLMEDFATILSSTFDLFVSNTKQIFSLYRQLSDFKNQMIASALGVSPIFVSVVSYIILGFSILIVLKKFFCRK